MPQNLKYLFFLALPVIAAAVWYSPILFKGYPVSSLGEQIVLGKNIAKTGMYALENDLNVLLSSSLIKEKGHESFIGNKLTGYLYAFVFKFFGFLSWNQIILFSIILNIITLLIFSFSVFYLFDFKTSVAFSLIYVFLPFNWEQAINPGVYEFALFFIALFFLFYFLGRRHYLFFILSGLFLVAAAMAREAFLLFIPIIFIYLLLKREKWTIILIFTPIFLVLSVFYLPGFLTNHNNYVQLFPVTEVSEKLKSNDFIFTYSEFYPDPYTYHFDKENFLEEYVNRRDSQSLIPAVLLQKGGFTVGIDSLNFGRRILLGFLLFVSQAGRFISWEEMGGPFIFLLMILGLYFLKKENLPLFQLFLWLILGVIFLLSFVVLAGRNHFMDFGWILALLIALGLLSLVSIIKTHFGLGNTKTFLIFGLMTTAVLYGLLLADHTYWGRVYDNKENLAIVDYASKIEKLNISNKNVIAFGSDGALGSAPTLNYLKDKSIVVFRQTTVKKLLENGRLKSAFKSFGVTHILGYPNDLSKEILKKADVVNISSSGADNIDNNEEITSVVNIRSWLMNFIR